MTFLVAGFFKMANDTRMTYLQAVKQVNLRIIWPQLDFTISKKYLCKLIEISYPHSEPNSLPSSNIDHINEVLAKKIYLRITVL